MTGTNPQGQQYTCPMHPEIVRDGPGACPKCGMALEPLDVKADDEGANPEYDFMRKRFISAAVLTIPLVIIAMREMLPGGHVLDNLASAQDSRLAGIAAGDPGGAVGRLGLFMFGPCNR
jgi:hypothetical protein